MSFGAPYGPRFPDMKPVKSPPILYTINGVGFTVYGNRDHDPMTNTYVITHFFTIFFVPIFAIGAYRVISALEGGWYFHGKVPLSWLTRSWNILMLLAIVSGAGAIWYSNHTSSPDTIAANRIADGDRLAAEGKVGEAAQKYNEVANNPAFAKRSPEAVTKLCSLFDGPIDQADKEQMLAAMTIGVDSCRLRNQPENVFEVGLAQAKKHADADPKTTLKVLELVTPIAPKGDQRVNTIKKPLLEKLVAQEPDNIDLLSDLAVVYESEKRFDECEKLLTPKQDQLGTREGARILGQFLASKGQFDKALPFLQGYAEERLDRLKAAEENQRNMVTQVDNLVIDEIRKGKAPGFDFARFEAMKNDQDQRNTLVRAYLDERLRNDANFKRALDALRQEARVVPVAFDLGIAQLQRGQTLADPEARKLELEKAEKTFLRIRGVAGQTDEFRLTLGQVYYWLGKQDEAKKLFDELLQGPNHESKMTLAVAKVLREVGAVSEARKMLEEAFEKEGFPGARNEIARIRGLMFLDLDDRIAWLEKVQSQDRAHKAELCCARGDKAIAENRPADADRELREALEHYAALAETAVTLNNSALVSLSLFRLNGDVKDMNLGIAKIEKALEMRPQDSILLHNAADSVLGSSLRAIIGDAIDWKVLKTDGSLELLGYLYANKAQKDAYREKVRKHEGVIKARVYYDRLTILSPRNPQSFATLTSLTGFLHERDALAKFHERLDKTGLDNADTVKRTLEAYQGKNIDQHLKDLQNSMDTHAKHVVEARKIGGVTLAVALGRLHRDKAGLFAYGKHDAADLVEHAEEAIKAAPSRATQGLLIEALLIRAHHDLLKKDAAYAAMSKDALRTLGASYLIAAALTRDGTAQKACLANQDVQSAALVIKAQCEAFDDEFNEWTWAMLHRTESQWTNAQAAKHLKNDAVRASRGIAKHLTPLNAGDAYRQHWGHLMRGQQAEADAVLREAAAKGVPLPK